MHNIEIDRQVMGEIENRAKELGMPLLTKTPNDALRAIFNLENDNSSPSPRKRRRRSASARVLLKEHQEKGELQDVQAAYYHVKGTNYTKPRDDQYPVVLFDPDGYIVIKTKRSLSTPLFSVANGVYVADGISSLKSYERCGHLHTKEVNDMT